MSSAFGSEWDYIEQSWREIHKDVVKDIDGFRKDMVEAFDLGRPVDFDRDSEDDSSDNDGYEHIEEEGRSFTQKLKKEREFTQYFAYSTVNVTFAVLF